MITSRLYRNVMVRIGREASDKLDEAMEQSGLSTTQLIEQAILSIDYSGSIDSPATAKYGQTRTKNDKRDTGTNGPRFTPPSLDEVRAHVKEMGYRFDPGSFHSFYESKGWKVGSTPMKSWRAACVTWQGRETANGNPPAKMALPAVDPRDAQLAEVERELAEIDRLRAERKAKA
jgi:hypothetical protein